MLRKCTVASICRSTLRRRRSRILAGGVYSRYSNLINSSFHSCLSLHISTSFFSSSIYKLNDHTNCTVTPLMTTSLAYSNFAAEPESSPPTSSSPSSPSSVSSSSSAAAAAAAFTSSPTTSTMTGFGSANSSSPSTSSSTTSSTKTSSPSPPSSSSSLAEPDSLRSTPLFDSNIMETIQAYYQLSKPQLSGLVTLTTMVGYAMAPGTLNIYTMLYTSVGTAMCISSANVINQWMEVPFDAQMSRTKNRPFVRGAITPFHGLLFGTTMGAVGTGVLCINVNSMVAMMGFSNILLYALVYTPSKRLTIANTWVGAVVGAIPPMMGWGACTGNLEDGAWLLGGILYAWQFPHFNSLSWNLRKDYTKAGYHMMSVTRPDLSKRVALRYALLLFPLCCLCPVLDMTTWNFAATSSIANCVLLYYSWTFYKQANAKTGKSLFFSSIMHLPILLCLLMIHKKKKQPTPLDDASEEHKDFMFDSEFLDRLQNKFAIK